MSKEEVPSVHESIENIFLRRNPWYKREQLLWRADDRLEFQCEHGVGHTVFSMDEHWTHGCDGCCKSLVSFSIKFNVPNSKEDKK